MLRSIIDRQKPIKVFDYECKLYQYQQLAIEVTNTLPGAGKFQIQMEQEVSLPVGKDGKPIFHMNKSDMYENLFIYNFFTRNFYYIFENNLFIILFFNKSFFHLDFCLFY